MCYHSYSQDSKSLRAKVEGRQWRRESKHKAVHYSDGRSPTRRPSLLLCCTDVSEKAIGTTEPQKNWSRGGWEKDLCSGPLLFPVQVSCTEQHLPLYSRVVFPSRWGSCRGSQISCPIASTSSEPGSGRRSQSPCETLSQTRMPEESSPTTGWASRGQQVARVPPWASRPGLRGKWGDVSRGDA